MNAFTDAVQSGFRQYADFSGRSARAMFWWWVLFVFLVNVVTGLAGELTGIAALALLGNLISLGLFLPSIAITVRRLHDVGKSGRNLLWYLTGIGALYILYLAIRPGQQETNAYGAPTKHPGDQVQAA